MGIFTRKTKKEKLQKKYEKLLKESFELSTTDRKASDQKQVQAEAVLAEMKELPN